MSYTNTDWYESLVNDVTSELSERDFEAKTIVLGGYVSVGVRLAQEIGDRAEYGASIIPSLNRDTGISTSTLYNALSIGRKYIALEAVDTVDFVEKLQISGKTPSVCRVLAAINPPKEETDKCEGHCNNCEKPCGKRNNNS